MLKTIIFDLDNTLTHRNASIEQFARYFFTRYQNRLNEQDSQQVLQIILDTDNGGYGRPDNPHPKKKHSIAIRLAQELDWRSAPDTEEILHDWVTQFPACSVEMPGAASLLHALKERGFQLAVLSNGAEISRRQTLEHLGFIPLLDGVFSSDALGIKKPEVGVFQAVMSQLNVSASECLYVGDHPINDIVGASGAGLHTLWLEGFHTWPAAIAAPQHRVSHLTQVLEAIRAL